MHKLRMQAMVPCQHLWQRPCTSMASFAQVVEDFMYRYILGIYYLYSHIHIALLCLLNVLFL